MNNSGPGYAQDPKHKITVTHPDEACEIIWRGLTIARSSKVLLLTEADYPPVNYFPRQDVNMDVLIKTKQKSYCPFKGYAVYWTIRHEGSTVKNVAWSYEAPYDEVSVIKNHIAFYEQKLIEGE